MNNSLRELTNTIDTLKTEHKEHTVKLPCSHELDTNRIQDLLAVSVSEIDFGECTPRNVLTQKLSIMLKKPLPFARIIGIKIICKDKTINDLPQFVFGIRKESATDYFDEFKFKASQKGGYSFVVGVQTPSFLEYSMQADMQIRMQGCVDHLSVSLKLSVKTPNIICLRQLIHEEGYRVIKVSIPMSKLSREIKIPFRINNRAKTIICSEIMGLADEEQLFDVKPKLLTILAKNQFTLSLLVNDKQNMLIKRFSTQLNLCVLPFRRILVLRLKDTNLMYHFPLEVCVCLDRRKSTAEEP